MNYSNNHQNIPQGKENPQGRRKQDKMQIVQNVEKHMDEI